MDTLEKLEKIINTNNLIIQIQIEAILATFDEEQTKRYKYHLVSDAIAPLSKTLSKEQLQEVKKVLGV